MPQQARVTSLDAIEAFRANLIVYLSQARPALEEVSADVLRTRMWLENDQRTHWENQLRRRAKQLEAAQQALFSARLSNLGHETAAQQMDFHRARRAMDEAETKLRIVKKWSREFEGHVQPLVKQVEKLHTIFSNDMAQAVIYLAQVINTLAAYAETRPSLNEGVASPPSSGQAGADQIPSVEKGI
jgi:predicted ATPase